MSALREPDAVQRDAAGSRSGQEVDLVPGGAAVGGGDQAGGAPAVGLEALAAVGADDGPEDVGVSERERAGVEVVDVGRVGEVLAAVGAAGGHPGDALKVLGRVFSKQHVGGAVGSGGEVVLLGRSLTCQLADGPGVAEVGA